MRRPECTPQLRTAQVRHQYFRDQQINRAGVESPRECLGAVFSFQNMIPSPSQSLREQLTLDIRVVSKQNGVHSLSFCLCPSVSVAADASKTSQEPCCLGARLTGVLARPDASSPV